MDEKYNVNNPLNEALASVGKRTPEVGEVDAFEMNHAEKTETLQEHPVNMPYDGPEPKPVDDSNQQLEQDVEDGSRVDSGDADGLDKVEGQPVPRPETRPNKEDNKNPFNEQLESVGEHTDEVGEVDNFEMNHAEKTETLQEHPVNQPYDGPEPKPVDKTAEREQETE